MIKMHENSLFAVLLRSPWWVSALVALGLVVAARLVLPELYALFTGLPFAVIAVYVAWQQLRAPGARRVAQELERLRTLSSEQFAGELAERFRGDGYTVNRVASDLELERGGRKTLVACRRFKAGRTGVEPLHELEAARKAREAQECIYVATGEITEQARAFARDHNLRLLEGAELAGIFIARR
jgi:restriction system protein